MSSPIPVPTDLIPVTDRHWHERWATELTRANALERELVQTRAARDAARKTCDDLTTHCEGQGDRIARVENERDIYREEAAALRIRVRELSHEAESMRIERDDQRQLVVKLNGLNVRLQGEYEAIRSDAQNLADRQRPLEERVRDLELGINSKDRAIRALEDADGSGLLRARRERDEYRKKLDEILRGDAGEDCLECLGEGCHDCDHIGRVAK